MPRLPWFALLPLAGCGTPPPPPPAPAPPVDTRTVADELPPEPRNHVFTPPPADPTRPPRIVPIDLPAIHGGAAVWGGIGRDHTGRIYFGVCIDGVREPSAHLAAYDPETNTTADLGGAVENLQRLGLAKPGAGQNKIHTKVVQGADGRVYFASMDEGGESEDGTALPTFGSHLWRLTPGEDRWEHLAAVPEAVIAAAAGGRWVYFLGYYGHVLYQFDTDAGAVTGRVRVGSHGGHTTRNFAADDAGHVYVPRVRADRAELVEFDEGLREVGATLLADYDTAPNATSHGLVGVCPLADGGRAVLTSGWRAYRISPRPTGAAVADVGPIRPPGPCHMGGLFSFDGAAAVHSLLNVDGRWEWRTLDLRTRRSSGVPVELPVPAGAADVLVYGSTTRDDAGRFYVGGRYVRNGQSVAAAWRVEP